MRPILQLPSVRRLKPVTLATLLLLGQAAAVAGAAAEPCASPLVALGPTALADTLRLEGEPAGAPEVRLAGIDIPAPAASGGAGAGGLNNAAQQMLSRLTTGRVFCLLPADAPIDRYGRLLAQVERDDGLWLQGELLGAGLARVRPNPDVRERTAEMLAVEGEARAAGRGVWRSAALRIRTAGELTEIPLGYQIVEGRVVDAERHQDRWYLNFGEDWRSDFTVVIPKAALPDFARAGRKPYDFTGKDVRVRGWMQSLNGPMIEVIMPEQIEILPEARS